MAKEIIITSGKGGTGKTTVIAAFAAIARNATLADCDVDAADLHLVLSPEVIKREDFYSGHKAEIDLDLCVKCGKCRELCRFDAISEEYIVSRIACEGCGVCYEFCPAGAVLFKENMAGELFLSETRFGALVHAKLRPAEGNSGKLVSRVRKEARQIAAERGSEIILADGSPGIGCAVIASITGAHLIVLVTEPTASGLHDMDRVLMLAKHFGVPAVTIINKSDLNPEMSENISAYCREKGVEVVGKIPFDPIFIKAMVEGKTIMEYSGGVTTENIAEIFNKVMSFLKG